MVPDDNEFILVDRVMITGLQSRADLNGQIGAITRGLARNSRYVVVLDADP